VVEHGRLEDRLLAAAAARVLREEAHRDRVVAEARQRERADPAVGAREERVRELQEDARAVAGAGIAARSAAVCEVDEDLQRLGDHLVRGLAVERGHEAETAGVMLESWVVQALPGRECHERTI
jgi:hypothetical protein